MRLFKGLSGCGLALLGIACGDGKDPGVTLDWQVATNNTIAPAPRGVEGVTVCVDDHPEVACAKTDAGGFFTLTHVPRNTDLVLTTARAGYLPSLEILQTNAEPYTLMPGPLGIIKEEDLPTNLGYDINLKDFGVIGTFVFQSGGKSLPDVLPGVKLALSPETESTPAYYSTEHVYDSSLRATDAFEGPFLDNNVTIALFANVPPGEYKVIFTPPAGYTCQALGAPYAWGIPVPGESAVRVSVRAGHFTTSIGMDCTR